MKKFFILCLMAFVMCSCISNVSYTEPAEEISLKENARIEITINENISQYKHLKKWESSWVFDTSSRLCVDIFPYSIELGKTYYRYYVPHGMDGKKELIPFVVNWISFDGDKVWCSVTMNGKTQIEDGFFNYYNVFETIHDFSLWVESGNPQYIVPCGTLDKYIIQYNGLTYTDTNSYFVKNGYDNNYYSIYPSYSFGDNGVVCHRTCINYVYYKNNRLYIVCSRKYGTEEECRKGILGEMGLMK